MAGLRADGGGSLIRREGPSAQSAPPGDREDRPHGRDDAEGRHDPAVPQEQAWYTQALAEPDVSIAVQRLVDGLSEILRRVAPLDFAVRSAAAADPEASAFLASNEGMRAGGYREMVGLLGEKAPCART